MLKNIQRFSLSFSTKQPFGQCSNYLSKARKSHTKVRNLSKVIRPNQLTKNINFSYFTFVDKPIQSAALNSVIEFGGEVISYPFIEWSCPTQVSVVLGGIAFRIMIEMASKFIQVTILTKKEMKFSNYENRVLYKMVQKVFLVDLHRDIKFYVQFALNKIQQLDHRKAYFLQKYYKVSYLLKNLFTGYLSLNFFRSCHFILDSQQFNSFHIHTVWVPTLSSHDPKFLLPLITMGFTYLWLAKSRHPFMIHLTKVENLLYRINIAFMGGLMFVPLPAIYALGYIGMMSGHLLMRTLTHEGNDLREEWRDIFGLKTKFIEERQKKLKLLAQNGQDLKNEQSLEEKGKK